MENKLNYMNSAQSMKNENNLHKAVVIVNIITRINNKML